MGSQDNRQGWDGGSILALLLLIAIAVFLVGVLQYTGGHDFGLFG